MEKIESKIIGGMFGLEEPAIASASPPPFLSEQSLFFVNARSAIRFLVERLCPPIVWLPSYLCPAILDATEPTRTKISFYAIGADLAQQSDGWLDRLGKGDLVVVIDFFGFPHDEASTRRAQERGAWVLEDACQALLSERVGAAADFVVFSPRKFVGVPDGGILNFRRDHDLKSINLEEPPPEWWLKAWWATILRREFDLHGGSRDWFRLFQQVEADPPIGMYAMSELSRLLVTTGICYADVAQRRIKNYNLLLNTIGDLALFPSLPADVVPLGFPIRARNRDSLQEKLFAGQIYPPVHWPIAGVVPPEFEQSHQLSSEILTLPCDQRYGEADMERMASIISREVT